MTPDPTPAASPALPKDPDGLRPDQLNEHGQVTDDKILGKNRLLMGLGYILHHSEENAVGAVPVKIIRFLGGDDRFIGLYGMSGGIASVAQFFGPFFLKWKKSNRAAMLVTMFLGALFAAGVAAILLATLVDVNRSVALYAFVILALLFCAMGGVQLNIEAGWMGDLVPKNKLGWFASLKWILSVAGMFVFLFTIARIGDSFPHARGYAAVYAMFGFSFLAAALFIYPRVTDRTPKNVNYFSGGASHHDRLNYKSLPLWTYILYMMAWAGGRGMFYTFTSIYLIEYFGLKLTQLAWLMSIQCVMSIVALHLFGKATDKWGNRLPLLFVTLFIGVSMLLYPASAFLGITAIIVFQAINGLAGHTHTMLFTNYGLEIFPDKGRAAYIGLSRVFSGVTSMLSAALGGGLAYLFKDFQTTFYGALINRFHMVFLLSTAIVFIGLLPLLIVGKRRVEEV